jgi:hypothetical protein
MKLYIHWIVFSLHWIRHGSKRTIFIPTEGPDGVGTVFSFFTADNHVIFMNSQEFLKQEKTARQIANALIRDF